LTVSGATWALGELAADPGVPDTMENPDVGVADLLVWALSRRLLTDELALRGLRGDLM
jgi:hypothetical protein